MINKQGVVRYQAFDHWPYGNRYHLNELRGCIDSLLTVTVGVDEGAPPRTFRLAASPNPSRGPVAIELANPSEQARETHVDVFDLSGRAVARVWSGPAAPGITRLSWTGLDADGAPTAPGVYLVRARVGDAVLTRRVLRIR